MSKELEAFNRIMETYGKTNSLEGTYDDFLTIKRALLELKTIKEANPSDATECLENIRKDIYDFYTDYLDDISTIKQALLKAQEDEKLKVDICEMFGLDNLFPYNDTKAILKELEEYMGRKNQLWVDFMKISKQFKEQEKILNIIFKKKVDIYILNDLGTLEEYNEWVLKKYGTYYQLTQEEFDLLKR